MQFRQHPAQRVARRAQPTGTETTGVNQSAVAATKRDAVNSTGSGTGPAKRTAAATASRITVTATYRGRAPHQLAVSGVDTPDTDGGAPATAGLDRHHECVVAVQHGVGHHLHAVVPVCTPQRRRDGSPHCQSYEDTNTCAGDVPCTDQRTAGEGDSGVSFRTMTSVWRLPGSIGSDATIRSPAAFAAQHTVVAAPM